MAAHANITPSPLSETASLFQMKAILQFSDAARELTTNDERSERLFRISDLICNRIVDAPIKSPIDARVKLWFAKYSVHQGWDFKTDILLIIAQIDAFMRAGTMDAAQA